MCILKYFHNHATHVNSWFFECEAFNLPANCASTIKIFLAARQVYSDNYFLVRLKYHLKMPRHTEILLLRVMCVYVRVSSINISITQYTRNFFGLCKAITLRDSGQAKFSSERRGLFMNRRGACKVCKSFYCTAALAVGVWLLHLRLFYLSACMHKCARGAERKLSKRATRHSN